MDLVDPDETQVATADSDVKPRKIAKVQNVDKIEEEKEEEEGQGEKPEGEEKEIPGRYHKNSRERFPWRKFWLTKNYSVTQ